MRHPCHDLAIGATDALSMNCRIFLLTFAMFSSGVLAWKTVGSEAQRLGQGNTGGGGRENDGNANNKEERGQGEVRESVRDRGDMVKDMVKKRQ